MRYKNGARPNPVITVDLPQMELTRYISDFITSMTLNLEDRTFEIAVLDKQNSVITGRYVALYRGLLIFVKDGEESNGGDQTAQLAMLLGRERIGLQTYLRMILQGLVNNETILVEE